MDKHPDTRAHLSRTTSTCSLHLGNIGQIQRCLPQSSRGHVVNAMVTSRIDKCNADFTARLPAGHVNGIHFHICTKALNLARLTFITYHFRILMDLKQPENVMLPLEKNSKWPPGVQNIQFQEVFYPYPYVVKRHECCAISNKT